MKVHAVSRWKNGVLNALAFAHMIGEFAKAFIQLNMLISIDPTIVQRVFDVSCMQFQNAHASIIVLGNKFKIAIIKPFAIQL